MSQAQDDRSLLDKVQDWFGRTGLPLELETAAAFQKSRFDVTHSSLYTDSQTDKGREIDVVAFKRDKFGFAKVYFTIECKSSPNPWVVVTNPQDPWLINNHAYTLGFQSASVSKDLRDKVLREVSGHLSWTRSGGYLFRQAFSKDNDPAYAASMAALKSAEAVLTSEAAAPPRLVFVLPVIVVDAPLFECELGPDGKQTFREVRVSEFLFTALVPHFSRVTIRVVTRRALGSFAQNCADLSRRVAELLEPQAVSWIESLRQRKNEAKD